MFWLFLIVCYLLWVIGVVIHQMYHRTWTLITYPLAWVFVLVYGTPEILIGLRPDASAIDVFVTFIWCHLAGSIINPWIFVLTIAIPGLAQRAVTRR